MSQADEAVTPWQSLGRFVLAKNSPLREKGGGFSLDKVLYNRYGEAIQTDAFFRFCIAAAKDLFFAKNIWLIFVDSLLTLHQLFGFFRILVN